MDEKNKHAEAERRQDSAWIEAFLGGDQRAFDQLVVRYKDKVFNLCYRMLGDYEEANDCAQDTFVKVYRSLKRFREDASFSTWLHAIAVNTCKNKIKSAEFRHRKKMVGIEASPGEDKSGDCAVLADPGPSPLAQLAKREEELRLQRAISALAREPRTMIVLRDIEGLAYEEIARITGYNLGTVKSKLARARQQLREKLSGQ